MSSNIVIIGTGFAGMWSALSAQRLIKLNNKQESIQVVVIAPEPVLVVKPRLYEARPSSMVQSVAKLYEECGIKYIQGSVDTFHPHEHVVEVKRPSGANKSVSYDRLILAAGSTVAKPQGVPGLARYSFDVDTMESAAELERHLASLPSLPESSARNTVVVCGGGFTGIEVATELANRLQMDMDVRIILVDRNEHVGPGLSEGPRPTTSKALAQLNIETKLGVGVVAVDADSVLLSSGETIATKTAIWTAGVRATPLTAQTLAQLDRLSRIEVDEHLRAIGSPHIFAAGDTASALADDKGHRALMSCQHAIPLGRFAGYNAAADLIGASNIPYSQAEYTMCLDLGAFGAVVTTGWDRDVFMEGSVAKKVKNWINRDLIYPPKTVDEAMKGADPYGTSSDALFREFAATLVQA